MYFKLPKEREKMIKIIIKKVERKFQKHFSRNNGYFKQDFKFTFSVGRQNIPGIYRIFHHILLS